MDRRVSSDERGRDREIDRAAINAATECITRPPDSSRQCHGSANFVAIDRNRETGLASAASYFNAF